MKTKQFKVTAVSSNTNSFGLKSIVLVAADGEAWQILKSPYGGSDLPPEGTVIEFETSGTSLQKYGFSFECPTRLKDCPAKVLKDIFTAAELEAAKSALIAPPNTNVKQEVRIKLDISLTLSAEYSAEELAKIIERGVRASFPNNTKCIHELKFAEEHELYSKGRYPRYISIFKP